MLADLRRRPGMPWLATVCAAAVAAVGGCSGRGSVENDAVSSTAASFLRSAASEPAAACGLLAPATLEEVERDGLACNEAISAVAVAPMSADVFDVEVYGRDAMFAAGEATVFLARFDDGWRITAAGCTPRGRDLPYDCAIEGR